VQLTLKRCSDCCPRSKGCIIQKEKEYTSGLLRHFSGLVKVLFSTEDADEAKETVDQCFARSVQEYRKQSKAISQIDAENVFDCLHALITPTTILFDGPYPERSNRVIRTYPNHHDYFLRVSFVEESRLQYRFDREVDGRAFVWQRFWPFLSARGGLDVAGRSFKFLAYSQSALKDHAVWFVAPFDHESKGRVDASSIIRSLGNFTNLDFDPKLIYCPHDTEPESRKHSQPRTRPFPWRSMRLFPNPTSREMGGALRMVLEPCHARWPRPFQRREAARRRPGQPKPYAHALQIRFMGSKGMLCVDHKLSGRAVCLRESMIKFEAPSARELEIAKVFDKPGRYYLNRPLIMILEGLGVNYDVFRYYQERAVLEAQDSVTSLSKAGRLLEAHGLGNSFRLTSVMLKLDKLGVDAPEDAFYQRMMEFAVNHVLRDLKHRARIPIPGAWTLVGVADFHRFLRENEIFVCIRESYMEDPIYLEGDVVVSRSPTIHPGDVRVARAIGKPPPGSCFEQEPLPNTVVFSVKGYDIVITCLIQ
jgi:RNA dependent RNA polymerase.